MMVCYSINNGTAQVADSGSNKPCGSYISGVPQYCCADNDFCVGSSICHFTGPSEGEKSSGYYIGSCTDESFSSPACSKECSDLAIQDIVFNATSGLWSCCWGSNGLDCSDPTNEIFDAPSPEQLAVSLYTAVPSDSLVPSSTEPFLASSMTSQVSTMTSPASSSLKPLPNSSSNTSPQIITVFPQSSSTPNTGLRTGAKAGITVTGAVIGIALLAAIFYLLIRQARLRRPNPDDMKAARSCKLYSKARIGGELDTRRSVELDSSARVELPACIDTIEVE